MAQKNVLAGLLLATYVLLLGCSQPEALSPSGHRAHELSLAVAGEQIGAAWHGGREGDAIWLSLTDRSGKLAGMPVRLTDGKRNAFEPDLEIILGDFLVAWHEKDPADGSLVALVARFGRDGQRRWQRELSQEGANGRNPVIRVAGDAAMVAWIESAADNEAAIWTARIDADGNFLESPERRAPASNNTWNLNAAFDESGTFHLVYDAKIATQSKELQLLSIGTRGTTHSALSTDDGFDSSYPDIAFSMGRVAVTWFDAREGETQIYLYAGRTSDLRSALDTRAQRISQTSGPSIGAYVAWNRSRLGLAWCDATGGQNEIFTQIFNDQGVALAPARQLTRNDTWSLIPAIRPWRTGFAVAWNEYMPAAATIPAGHATDYQSTAMLTVLP